MTADNHTQNNDIFNILQNLFREILEEPDLELRPSLNASQVETWDSINHINLLIAVEREFDIRFTTREITGLQNVGEFITVLVAKDVIVEWPSAT